MQWRAKPILMVMALIAGLASPLVWAGDEADQALLQAAESGEVQGINQALDNGANVDARNKNGRTALIIAARKATPEAVKILLEAGSDVNAGTTASKKTALMGAARTGNTEIARLLAEAGADVNSRDLNGRTPLMVASKQGYHEIMTILIDNGAEAETKDRFGWDVRDYVKMGGDATVKHFDKLTANASDS